MSPVAVLSIGAPAVEDHQMIQTPKGSRSDIPKAILCKLFFADEPPLLVEIIDYLQLLKSPSKRSMENRQIEIAEISGGIKAFAKELGIPVIVLAQLNREAEKRGGVPRISDLRESGSIEQDADIVGLLYRSAYYGNNDQEKPESEGEPELIIAKHRNGATGAIPVTFLNQYTRFESRDTSPEEH